MKLTISAYERLYYSEDQQALAPGVDSAPGLVRIPLNGSYAGFWPGGVYATDGRSIEFSAGTTMGYNAWREELARCTGQKRARYAGPNYEFMAHCAAALSGEMGLPFGPLIRMPYISACASWNHCEAVRMWFDHYAGSDSLERTDLLMSLYDKFAEAFEIGATRDSGCIIFRAG